MANVGTNIAFPYHGAMHTPEGFTPRHALPSMLPASTLAFAFREARLLVAGPDDAPIVPRYSDLEPLGVAGAPHYLGELQGTGCVAVPIVNDVPAQHGWRYAGLRSLFFRLPEPLLAIA